jgi:hypothetical protein
MRFPPTTIAFTLVLLLAITSSVLTSKRLAGRESASAELVAGADSPAPEATSAIPISTVEPESEVPAQAAGEATPDAPLPEETPTLPLVTPPVAVGPCGSTLRGSQRPSPGWHPIRPRACLFHRRRR